MVSKFESLGTGSAPILKTVQLDLVNRHWVPYIRTRNKI